MSIAAQQAINWIEQGYLPDSIIRKGIRRLLKQRLIEIHANDAEQASLDKQGFISELITSPIAVLPEKANEQHYEIPARFYHQVLGPRKKYSCSYWDESTTRLEEAEANALYLSCTHARLENGQSILELGCGWGSLTVWMAEQYPDSQITAVSNSHSQRQHIEALAAERGLHNIEVLTRDMNEFSTDKAFDRIVSIEMFEHMRNWPALFGRIASWLKPEGEFFMHVFSHHLTPYVFEVKDSSDWMSEYFFSGGMMPCDDLPLYFQDHLKLEQDWSWNGQHYEKTSNAWLENMDAQRLQIMPLITDTYGVEAANTWWMRWRIFFMACAELFGYDNGQQWHVKHYRFSKR